MAAPSTTSLELPSAQALQSSEQMTLLNAVDELRAHGLGEITPLPQLVVCGDQSSGKSSVLEAISGVPFPRKANVCTRFATEVILRRARVVRMSVSIMPSQDLPREDRERILGFRHDLASIEDFAGLFEKAKEVMGISDNKKTFSKDVLRVEFWGPTQPQLTLVDLPGLIHSETRGQTKDDIKLVNDLVTSYLKSPASIILAIISARYDINNQVILRRAREVDPEGKRTLGIITKPDTIDNDDDEREFIKIARNENVRFVLGWHVVKNLPSISENAEPEDRDEKETEFFNKSAFSVLPRKDVGIASLRTRLSSVLFDQIKVELPRLIEDIENRARATKAARDRLGPSRSTIDEQRSFLIDLSESFQNICRDAVAGHYDHDFFRGDVNGERHLCANLMNKHFEFARSLRRKGALWKITREEDEESDGSLGDDGGFEEESDDERERTREEAIEEARKVLKRSRGRELPGLPNPLLVGELFREYSRPWEGLARYHITDVWNTTNRFLELVLQYLTDSEVRDKIFRYWLDPIMDRSLELAEEKLKELLEVHKDHPMTTNHEFIDNRRKLQKQRSEESPTTDMDLVAAEDAFDNMNAYYKVAMSLFMDNVPTLAVQAPIVRKLPTMLSPVAVSKMDVEVIKKIAGESEGKVLEREETLRTLEQLQDGARICKEYALRRSSVSHPAEGSGNVAAEQSSTERRAPGRRHNPSVSEDGRAASRSEEQRTYQASSTRLGDTLNVPKATAIQKSASTGTSLGSFSSSSTTQPAASKPTSSNLSIFASQPLPKSSTGGGGLFSHLLTSSAPSGTTSNNPTSKPGLFTPRPGESSTSAPSNATGTVGQSLFASSTTNSVPGTFGGTSLFSTQTSAATEPTIASSSSPFSGIGSKPTSGLSAFTFSNATGSGNTSSFGSSGFASTSASAPSNKGAEVRQKTDIFKNSDIEKMKLVSTAPTTHEFCWHGLSPFEAAEPNSVGGVMNHFPCIAFHLPFRKFSFEELRLADYADGYWHEVRPEWKDKIIKAFPYGGQDDETLRKLFEKFNHH